MEPFPRAYVDTGGNITIPCSGVAQAAYCLPLAQTAPMLLAALELPLMFYAAGPWTDVERQRWKEITGTEEATTKTMCDAIRAATAKAKGGA